MRQTLFILTVFFFQFIHGQSEIEAVEKVIDQFFEGFHQKNIEKLRETLDESPQLFTTYRAKDSSYHLKSSDFEKFILAVVNRPESPRWEEKILSKTVQIDGALAQLWAPYEFWLDNKFLHCGANAFTLRKTASGWKIIHLIDSRRQTDCRSF